MNHIFVQLQFLAIVQGLLLKTGGVHWNFKLFVVDRFFNSHGDLLELVFDESFLYQWTI